MHGRPKPANPWNKNIQHKKTKHSSHNLENPPLTSSEIRFKEAHSKLQAAVKKHVKDYESSSEEEELDSVNLIEHILKNYNRTGSENENIGRTQSFIEEAFLSGGATCLICISRVKRDDEIWSCSSCYGFFHIMCIQRWSKDTITQQKQALEGQIVAHPTKLCWCCPKCRFEYKSEDIPTKYLCFCKKTENPKFQPFLVPHSCGEICKKDLYPLCGHQCLLLCHPGPCPPCPVTVSVSCYCGSQPPKIQRCSNKEWSCKNACGKTLECEKHACTEPCHSGKCKPCPKKSIQKCMCKSQQTLRDCATPSWHCDKVCNKLLECGNHRCQKVCHAGVCDDCSLNKSRTCPCGKTTYQLPCTEETPTCRDTCDKLLECGIHTCNQRCHKDKCGLSCADCQDQVAEWWTTFISIACYWLLDDDSNVEHLYKKIELIPEALASLNDPLPKSIVAAFIARKNYLTSDSDVQPRQILHQCDYASHLLADSLTFTSCKKKDNLVLLAQLLVCDWLLETRTSLWEDSVDAGLKAPVSNYVLTAFQADLSSLRSIAEHIPCALARVFLYDATARLMAGAAPGRTQQLLDRSLRQRHSKSSIICGKGDRNQQEIGGEREHASALYMACKHLPGPLLSSPGERAGMLVEAAKTLERIGDKKRLQDCYKVMKTLGTNAVNN